MWMSSERFVVQNMSADYLWRMVSWTEHSINLYWLISCTEHVWWLLFYISLLVDFLYGTCLMDVILWKSTGWFLVGNISGGCHSMKVYWLISCTKHIWCLLLYISLLVDFLYVTCLMDVILWKSTGWFLVRNKSDGCYSMKVYWLISCTEHVWWVLFYESLLVDFLYETYLVGVILWKSIIDFTYCYILNKLFLFLKYM